MSVWIYTTRKKHQKNVHIDGGVHNLIHMGYGYRYEGGLWPGDRGYREYAMRTARAHALATDAVNHWYEDYRLHNGRSDNAVFYLVTTHDGKMRDGDAVYRTHPGRLPESWTDCEKFPHAECIGRVWRIGRKWVVQRECPGHHWTNNGNSQKGDPRPEADGKGLNAMLPAEVCNRCGEMRYVDPEMNRIHDERYGTRLAA